MSTFPGELAVPLLLTHFAVGAGLVGVSAWHAIAALRAWMGRAPSPRLRLLALGSAGLSLVALGLGSIVYPAYRVEVRARYLKTAAPWAVNAFDIKENLAVLAVACALAAAAMARGLDPSRDRRILPCYASLAAMAALLALSAGVIGFLVTRVKHF